MKTAVIPILVQDPLLSKQQDIRIVEGYEAKRKFFLDGPVTDRVAVLDFDPDSDELVKGVHFNKGVKEGWFEDEEKNNISKYTDEEIYSPAFIQTSAFATVLKVLDLFDEKRAMGRPLTWAFNSPQLLIIPRAGEMANAYYQRDSHSLQFFYFPSEEEDGRTIYSSLSRDIVAHETGHAVIDGIVPSLMDSASPQSLAIHEALADIIAMLMAFSSHNLREYLLDKHNGSIKDISEFSTIAEEFGAACGKRDGLRNLLNTRNLDPADPENYVDHVEPHALSEVLSGALYNLMINIHEALKEKYKDKYLDKPDPLFSASGVALGKGIYRFIRMVFRALDYLPVGCVSFMDYGRAMIAVDEIAYPDAPEMREWLREEFLKRHIINNKDDLGVTWNRTAQTLEAIDINDLCSSDWLAYRYVNANRGLFGIPEEIPFKVHPRLDVTKRYDDDRFVRECILKVSWEQEEVNPYYPNLPKKRVIMVGSTAVFDWQSGRILMVLSNAQPPESRDGVGQGVFQSEQIREDRWEEYEKQKKDRDDFILEMLDKGVILFGPQANGPDGKSLPSVIRTEVINDVMRLKNTFNLLHIAEVE